MSVIQLDITDSGWQYFFTFDLALMLSVAVGRGEDVLMVGVEHKVTGQCARGHGSVSDKTSTSQDNGYSKRPFTWRGSTITSSQSVLMTRVIYNVEYFTESEGGGIRLNLG